MQAKFLPHFLSAQADRRFNIFHKIHVRIHKTPTRTADRNTVSAAPKKHSFRTKAIRSLRKVHLQTENIHLQTGIQLFTQFIHFSNGRPEEISPQSSLFQITPAGFVPGRRPRIPDKAPPLPHKLRKSKSSPDFPDMSHFYITFVL